MKSKKQRELDSLVGFKGEGHQGYMNEEETASQQKKRAALEVMEACRRDIGPLWHRLERLGLNTKRADRPGELERRRQKMAIAHESHARDAESRYRSADANLIISFVEMKNAVQRTYEWRWKQYKEKKRAAKAHAQMIWDAQLLNGVIYMRIKAMKDEVRKSVFNGSPHPNNRTIEKWLRELTRQPRYSGASRAGRPKKS